MLYPTIKTFGNADNVALKPKYVDNNPELISVEYGKITAFREGEYATKTLDSAITLDKDVTIQWSRKYLGLKVNPGQTVSSKFTGNDWVSKSDGLHVGPVLTSL